MWKLENQKITIQSNINGLVNVDNNVRLIGCVLNGHVISLHLTKTKDIDIYKHTFIKDVENIINKLNSGDYINCSTSYTDSIIAYLKESD